MAPLDWIVLGVLLASIALGVWRGLVYEVMSVLGWIAAFVLAQWFGPEMAQRLPMGNASGPIRYAAGLAVVFVAAAFAGGLVAWITRKLVETIGLRPVDRTLGAAFGLLRGLVILLAAVMVLDMTPLRNETWVSESKGVAVLTAALKGLQPMLPAEFTKYFPG